MTKMIYFDMDETLNRFYKGPWLEDLNAESVRPYVIADCVVKESVILGFINEGYKVGIISWLSMNGSEAYNKAVREVKKDWLKINYPHIHFDEIHIVKYGTPKWSVAKHRDGILYDDDIRNRQAWKGIAIDPKVIRGEIAS